MNITFMQQKYTIDQLVSQYLIDIQQLKSSVRTPGDATTLQTYYQAANTFKGVSIKDLIQFAVSLGRSNTGKSALMRGAFPTLLGNRVTQPNVIDLGYAQLLLAYTQAFKVYRSNIDNWMLRFVLSSRFSPLAGFMEHAIDDVIQQTSSKIHRYGAFLNMN